MAEPEVRGRGARQLDASVQHMRRCQASVTARTARYPNAPRCRAWDCGQARPIPSKLLAQTNSASGGAGRGADLFSARAPHARRAPLPAA